MADASRPAFLLPQLTMFSNTKEAWEWHRHSPDQYSDFSISAYIMALYEITLLSEPVYVGSSLTACSLDSKGKEKSCT